MIKIDVTVKICALFYGHLDILSLSTTNKLGLCIFHRFHIVRFSNNSQYIQCLNYMPNDFTNVYKKYGQGPVL